MALPFSKKASIISPLAKRFLLKPLIQSPDKQVSSFVEIDVVVFEVLEEGVV